MMHPSVCVSARLYVSIYMYTMMHSSVFVSVCLCAYVHVHHDALLSGFGRVCKLVC